MTISIDGFKKAFANIQSHNKNFQQATNSNIDDRKNLKILEAMTHLCW